MKKWDVRSLIGVIYIGVLFFQVEGKAQNITTIAGTGASTFSGEGVPAIVAQTPGPNSGAFDRDGNYYFCDGVNSHRIRKINPTGIITTVAGNGMGGFAGDGGPATAARLNTPAGVAVDMAGNIYIADAQNNRVRKVTVTTGIITTIAGTGTGTYDFDGVPATTASLWGIQDICLDKFGNLYIADGFNYRIRKVTPGGIISTYAGNGTAGYGGEGVSAISSNIGLIVGICSDTTGNIYISSNTICRVMKISALGIMTSVAGNGATTYIGDALPATSAQIIPGRVFVDSSNNLFIADRNNNRVYKVENSTGVLYNIAGDGSAGDAGDGGSATSASLYTPVGVSADACGNLYIPTLGSLSVAGSGRRIRKIIFNPPTTPTITVTGVASATVGATVTVNATVSNAGSSYTIKWFKNSTLFSTTTLPTTTYIKGTGTDIITARVLPAVTTCYDSAMSASAHLVAEGTVGVQQLTHKSDILHLHPNPAQHTLAVSCDAGLAAVSVLNMVGREVAQQDCAGETTINLQVQELPPGIYLVHATATDGSKVVARFVKE